MAPPKNPQGPMLEELRAEEARETTSAAPPGNVTSLAASRGNATGAARGNALSPNLSSRVLLFSGGYTPSLPKTPRAKTVLISGGTAGIGRALVEIFANNGFNVATFSSTDARVLATQAAFKTYPNVFVKKADIRDQKALSLLVEEAEQKFGPIEFLINNAAVTGPFLPNTEVSIAEREITLATNLTGLMDLTTIIQNKMNAAKIKDSVIVNLSSMAAEGIAGAGVYSASKAGVNAFTACIAEERKPFSSHFVFAFDPGPVDTDMQAKIRQADPEKFPFALIAIKLAQDKKLKSSRVVAEEIYFLMNDPKLFQAEVATVLSHTAVRAKMEGKATPMQETAKRRASVPW